MVWISVEDRLPDFDEYVIWYFESGNMSIEALDKDEDIQAFLNLGLRGLMPDRITHWMKRPEPPIK